MPVPTLLSGHCAQGGGRIGNLPNHVFQIMCLLILLWVRAVCGVLVSLCCLLFGGPSPWILKAGSFPHHFQLRALLAQCQEGEAARWPMAPILSFSWHTHPSEKGTRFP